IETAIYEQTTASYVQRAVALAATVQEILSTNDDFKTDVDDVQDGSELCELWSPSFEWLIDEMIYPYPYDDGLTTSWFNPLINWCIINSAANLPNGRKLVGRGDAKQQLAANIASARKAAQLSNLIPIASAPSASSTSNDVLNNQTKDHNINASPSSVITPSRTSHDGASNIPYDVIKKKTKAIVGEPPSSELIFDGVAEKYLQWRVAILEKLDEFDDVPNRIQAEAILSCIRGPNKAPLKREVTKDLRCERGGMAVIDILDKKYKTSLAL
ncbi:hypothetical protein FOL47_004469, partial [Perkinsus chesapeaki]